MSDKAQERKDLAEFHKLSRSGKRTPRTVKKPIKKHQET